jgi:hypothetical protein
MKRKAALAVLIVSAALIGAGLILGEYPAILEKARAICLSCIGIG